MKKIVRLKESELVKIIKKVISEQDDLYDKFIRSNKFENCRGIKLTAAERKKDRAIRKQEKQIGKQAKRQGKSVEDVEKDLFGNWKKFADMEIEEGKMDTLIDSNIELFKDLCAEDADAAAKAAISNSETFNRLNKNYSKYFENGKLIPSMSPRDIGYPELIFFKNYFPTEESITPTQILNFFKDKGGLLKYKEVANNFYKLI